MSFKKFQKNPNRLTSRDIGFLLLAGTIIILVFYGLVVTNRYLAQLIPDGGEFHLLRIAGRSFLFDRIEPYSGNVPQRVQEQVYGRQAVSGEDLYILDIPFHLLMLFFPLALIPDASVARLVWMALSEIAIAGLLFFSFRLVDRRVPVVFVVLISICSLASYYAYLSFLDGSLAFILGFIYVGILVSLRTGLDELTGALMVISALQWEVGGLFLLLITFWVFWDRRWRVFTGGGMLAFILLVVSFFWYPGWFLPFLQASWNSFRTSSGYSSYDILVQIWPQFGNLISWALTAILIVALGYEWRAVRKADFNRLVWAACLTLAVSPLLGYRIETDLLLPLTLPILLVIIFSRERWQKIGNVIAFLLLLLFFGLPWLFFMHGMPQGFGLPTEQALFLFWPVFTVIGLYWVRWWVIRPPRTWLDRYSNKNYS